MKLLQTLRKAETWLEVKRAEEQMAASRFQEALQAQMDAKAVLARLENWQREYEGPGLVRQGSFRLRDLQDYQLFREGLAKQRRRAQAQLKAVDSAVKERRSTLLRAAQQRKLAELYREKCSARLALENQRSAQRGADELAGQQAARMTR